MTPVRLSTLLIASLITFAMQAGCSRTASAPPSGDQVTVVPPQTVTPPTAAQPAQPVEKQPAAPTPRAASPADTRRESPPASAAVAGVKQTAKPASDAPSTPKPERKTVPTAATAKDTKPASAPPARPEPRPARTAAAAQKAPTRADDRKPAGKSAAAGPGKVTEKRSRQDEKAPLLVTAEVLVPSAVPDPGSVPYKDCLTFIKYKVLSVERGEYGQPELLAVHWGMKDGKLTPAAGYRAGDRHRLELEPFSQRPELARIMQADDTSEFELSPYWVR